MTINVWLRSALPSLFDIYFLAAALWHSGFRASKEKIHASLVENADQEGRNEDIGE